MKKLMCILAVLLFFTVTTSSIAQVQESRTINLTSKLVTTISLDMSGTEINFNFVTIDDYKKGLGGYEGDYSSWGSVSSTANWKLSFSARGQLTHSDGQSNIPLNNVGLRAKWTGDNRMKNRTRKRPLPLSEKETVILKKRRRYSNAGDENANSFVIYWEMGTRKGKMNKVSIFDQDLKKGAYRTEVDFFATEVL